MSKFLRKQDMEAINYFSHNLGMLNFLYSESKDILQELINKYKSIPLPARSHRVDGFNGTGNIESADFYSSFGYLYGLQETESIDMMIFPNRKWLFHTFHPTAAGESSSLYKLCLNFSEKEKYDLRFLEEIPNRLLILDEVSRVKLSDLKFEHDEDL